MADDNISKIRKALASKGDDKKLETATAIAKSKFKDKGTVKNAKLDKEIRKTFKDLGGNDSYDATVITETASPEMTNDDPGATFTSVLKNVADSPSWALANGLDWLNDNVFGNAVGFFNHDLGENIKSQFRPEDIQGIVDLGVDAGLMFLPGGAGIVAAKNAAQNSDQLYEAITGKDYTTGNDIDLGERASSGVSAALSTALSAAPLAGAAKAGKVAAKAEKEAAEEAAKIAAKEAGEKTAAEAGEKAAAEAGEAAAAEEAFKNLSRGEKKKLIDEAGNEARDKVNTRFDKKIQNEVDAGNRVDARWTNDDYKEYGNRVADAINGARARKAEEIGYKNGIIDELRDMATGAGGSIRNVGRMALDATKDAAGNTFNKAKTGAKNLYRDYQNDLPAAIRNEIGSSRFRHPFDKGARDASKATLEKIGYSSSVQNAINNSMRNNAKKAMSSSKSSEAAKKAAQAAEYATTPLRTLGKHIAPAAANVGAGILTGQEMTPEMIITSALAGAMPTPKRMQISPITGRMGSSIPMSALAVSKNIEQANRHEDDPRTDVSDALTMQEILNRLKIGGY